jgi:hypothetical protein
MIVVLALILKIIKTRRTRRRMKSRRTVKALRKKNNRIRAAKINET